MCLQDPSEPLSVVFERGRRIAEGASAPLGDELKVRGNRMGLSRSEGRPRAMAFEFFVTHRCLLTGMELCS
jgi:hypothetical protein